MNKKLLEILKFRCFYKQFFPIKTTQATYIQAPIPQKQKFTRESLAPQTQKEISKIVPEEQKKINKFDDKIKENHVSVKINSNKGLNEKSQKIFTPNISIVLPRPEKKLFVGVRRGVPSSVKKLRFPMKSIIGLNIHDALLVLDNQETKAASFVKRALLQVIDHANNKEADIDRLYVQSALTGKYSRIKKMYYHAKSRFGLMTSDRSQLRIILEEKELEEFWRQMLTGHAPIGIAMKYREDIKENQYGFDKIKAMVGVTTAKGRQQARLMMKRFVQKKEKELIMQGLRLSKREIEDMLIGDKVKEICENYKQMKLDLKTVSLSKRQAVFKKNEEN